jgi:uncharacterized protein (DUF2235 family)
MGKNILIFADGTGNEGGLLPDESRTNVYKLYCATRTGPDSIIDPAKQIAFYVPGIGTPKPFHNSAMERLTDNIRQMFGFGITQKIIDCYVAIVSVWQPGDRIYLFGFSRGAYTARCVAHVLEVCGVPTREPSRDNLNFDPPVLRKLAKAAVRCLYTLGMPNSDATRDTRLPAFKASYAPQTGAVIGATAYFVGIWDAVAAVGWQRVFPDWAYDKHFAPSIRYARHLQSIDEGRKDFKRVPWGGSGTVTWADRGDEPDQFDQIWFAGNHADVGGSYPENESRLSDITLRWMVEFITQKVPEAGRVLADPTLLRLYPACDGMMHDECMVGIGGSPLHWSRTVREVPDEATLHDTVYQRLALPNVRNFTSYGPYRPAALRNHSKAKAFYNIGSSDEASSIC